MVNLHERKGFQEYLKVSKEQEAYALNAFGEDAPDGYIVADIALDKTPFFPAQGGQVCDRGILTYKNLKMVVVDVFKQGEAIFHRCVIPAKEASCA